MHLKINNKDIEAQPGMTVLEAAQANGIEIPTLCAHKDLSPFGACRLCIVDIEGLRGFNTACTTPASEGMIVRTDTPELELERRQTLQLLLSRHPSGCLVCDNHDNCEGCMDTLRKVGVTTGCRTCPKDGQCELQDVVESMGIKELDYPASYRHVAVERYDPFFDRDYNLCILCGRCVQACNELRFADVLTFVRRGHKAVIGTAYGRSHLDSGCEFCGTCVSVCPTGALYEKANKWDGIPDEEIVTTCPFCGVGCQMKLLVKNGEVIGSLPVQDEQISDSQLCVKGRFSVTEMVTNPYRMTLPGKLAEGLRKHIEWDEAVELAAEKLKECSPQEFGMLVSPNCTTEDLYVAQKFSRVVMGSNQIDTSASLQYGDAYSAYCRLLGKSVPMETFHSSQMILTVGLDSRYDRSVVGVEIYKAVNHGASLMTIHNKSDKLDRAAAVYIDAGHESIFDLFDFLLEHTSAKADENIDRNEVDERWQELLSVLLKAGSKTIVLGSEYLYYDDASLLLDTIYRLAENTGAGIVLLPVQNNFVGSLMAGACPDLLPGGHAAAGSSGLQRAEKIWHGKPAAATEEWDAHRVIDGNPMKVLYLVGENIGHKRPAAEYLIYQNAYPVDGDYQPDLVLPSALFSEVNGTYINQDGRVQRVCKAVDAPGSARPDWEILCMIARKMGFSGFDYQNDADIRAEMSEWMPGFQGMDASENETRQANSISLEIQTDQVTEYLVPRKNHRSNDQLLLEFSHIEHSYYGNPLSRWVAGLRELYIENTLVIHPQDAECAGIAAGDEAIVSLDGSERTFPILISDEQEPGVLHINQMPWNKRFPNPVKVQIRKSDV